MYNIEVKKTIAADAEDVWETVARGDGVHTWFTGVITACRLDGTDRYCTMADGSELEERILGVDHEKRSFRYAVDKHPLPATDVISSVQVRRAPEGAEVTWSCQFNADGAAAPMVSDMLKQIYSQGIDGLAAHHAKAA